MSADRYPVAYGLDLSASPPVCWREPARGTAKAVAWPPDEAIRRELAKGTAALAIAAPARATVVRQLEAPFASARKAARVWASLLDMDLPFPVEAARCDYAPLPPAAGKARALACAVRRADLDAFLDDAAEAGAVPAFCDAEALALWNEHLRDAPPSGADRIRLLVHAAADHVTVLRGCGRELGTVHVLRSAPAALPAAQWRARFRQIAFSSGDAPTDVWWSGSADAAALRDALSGEPGLRHETHRDPATFLARALARRAADGQCAALLPPDRLPPAIVRRRQRRLRAVWTAAAAASILVLALNAAVRCRFRAEDARLQAQLSEAAAALTDAPLVPGQEVLMAERALAADAPAWDAMHAARTADPRAPYALAVLRELAGRDVRFSRVTWSPAGLDIAGDAPSARAVENLTGWTPNATVQPSPDAGRVTFRLKGEWPDGL